MDETRHHTSESKFVEWSRSISTGSFGVVTATQLLGDRSGQHGILRGLDVGGGIGTFAAALSQSLGNCRITVVDRGVLAKAHRVENPDLDFVSADFFDFTPTIAYDFIVFKTVLHHLIGPADSPSESGALEMQVSALVKAKQMLADDGIILVEENYYNGVGASDVTGRLIFFLTKSKLGEGLVRRLGANTAGEGVRFRSHASWNGVFAAAGLRQISLSRSDAWGTRWPFWQKYPLLAVERYKAFVGLVPVDRP